MPKGIDYEKINGVSELMVVLVMNRGGETVKCLENAFEIKLSQSQF